GSRRARRGALSLGRLASGRHVLRPTAAGHGYSPQPPRAARPVGRLSRVGRGLGRRGLLCPIAGARPPGAAARDAEDRARRRVAPQGPVESGGSSLLAVAELSLFRLRLSRGASGREVRCRREDPRAMSLAYSPVFISNVVAGLLLTLLGAGLALAAAV